MPKINFVDVKLIAPELGVFFVVMSVIFFIFMNKIRGKFYFIETYISSRDWEFLNSPEKLERMLGILKFIMISMLFWPVLSLAMWTGALLYFEGRWGDDLSTRLGISNFFICCSFMLVLCGSANLKWRQYQINSSTIWLIFSGLLAYTAFQLIVVFMEKSIDFIGISAIFISANGVTINLLLFFLKTQGGVSINSLLSMLEKNQEIYNDIMSIFTIPKVESEYVNAATSGGIQSIITSPKYAEKKKYAIAGLYLIALGILVAYSVTSYNYSDYYALGILNSILIELVDLLVLLYIYAEISRTSYSPVFLSLASRFFIFILTEESWFIGYSCVYWIFTLVLLKNYINNKFPLINSPSELKNNEKDLARTIEFVYLANLIVYVVLTVSISIGEPSGVPMTAIYIQGNKVPLHIISICVILLSFVGICSFICLRLVSRKIRGIKDQVSYFLFFRDFDLFWIISTICIVICWACGIAVFLSVDSKIILILFAILPIIIILELGFYANWVKNDYSVVQNPKAHNVSVQRKIKQEEEILEKVRIYQDEFMANAGQSNNNSSFVADPNTGNLGMSTSRRFLPGRSLNTKDSLRLKLGLCDIDKLREKMPELMHDWTSEMSPVKAFFTRKLLKADYLNVALMFLSILLACVLAGLVYGVDRQMRYGVTIAVMIICLNLVLLPLQHNYATSIPIGIKGKLLILLGFLLNFGYGFIFYQFQLRAVSNSEENGLNVLFNTFVLPVLITYSYGIAKLHDNKWKMTAYSNIMLLLAQVFSLACAVLVLIVVDFGAGIALFGFTLVVAIYVAIFIKYCNCNHSLPRGWMIFTEVYTLIISFSGVGIGIARPSLGIYAGCSITFLFYCAAFIIYSAALIRRSFTRTSTLPVFFSPWVFPIYQYLPSRQDVTRADQMGQKMFVSLGLVLAWSVSCVIWMDPVSIGISVGCLAEVLLSLMVISLSSSSPVQFAEALQLMNPDENLKTIKKAWNESKTKFLEKKGAANFQDFPSFYELFTKVADLKLMIASKNLGRDKDLENVAWKRCYTEMNCLRDLYTELYVEETNANDQYLLELELIVHFQLLIILISFSSKTNEIQIYNNLIVSKSIELKAFGISFSKEEGGKTLAERYSHMMREVAKLDHIQRSRFEFIKEQYLVDLEEQRAKRKLQEAEEKKAIAARLEAAKVLHEERIQALKRQSTRADVPVDEMVDSKEKYQKIVEQCRSTGVKFEDKQFVPTEKSLGATTMKNVHGWKRADQCVLYEGGVSPSDVKQGAIGDCYFLSAISVVGEKRIKEIFAVSDQDALSGAYLLRFYRYGDPVYVIVDDYFPVNSENKWAFAQTVSGTEIWPMLLEKAYAKLNGIFDNIVAGKVHYALSDLTGGQPEEIKLESSRDNPESLWSKLMSYKKSSYPMGAGSPENPQGDLAVSQNGIVQGHAYGVLDVQEVDGERVIQLKNPHGQFGQEWRGDWGDGSSKWTKKAIAQLKYEEKPDGMFWMSLEDFVWEFKNLYVCRIFDDPKWAKLEKQGKWAGEKAAGFPCKDNPQARAENNPQFLLNVTKPCVSFITLTQMECVDMFKGKSPIMFLIYSSNKKVTEVGKGIMASSGKPTDLRIVSNEITLEKAGSYIILVTAMYQGERGTGAFELNVIVDDLKATLTEAN